MSIPEKLVTIAENQQKIYEAGKAKATDEFWKVFTDSGKRDYYVRAFQYWNCEEIISPYPIKLYTGNPALNTFAENPSLKIIRKTADSNIDFTGASATLSQTSESGGWRYTFISCNKLEELEDVGMPAASYHGTFQACHKLHTIEVLRFLPETRISKTPFDGCTALENLTIEGEIGQNGFNIQWSSKLTHESLMSIINALVDYSEDTSGTDWLVTLGATNLAKLTAADISIAENKGWRLA